MVVCIMVRLVRSRFVSWSLNPDVWSVNPPQVPTTDEIEKKGVMLLSTAGVKLSFRLPPKYALRRGRPKKKDQERKKSAIEKASGRNSGAMQMRKKGRGALADVPRNFRLHAEVAAKAEVRLTTPPCYGVRVLQNILSALTII